MRHAPARRHALTDIGCKLTPSAFEDLRVANVNAGDDDPSLRTAQPLAPAEDRLMTKAQKILVTVQKRDQHFGHALMADHAMDVMLSLFLAEFSEASCPDAASALANQHVINELVEAGLIELAPLSGEGSALGLTPTGAGRLRSFISAYPDAL